MSIGFQAGLNDGVVYPSRIGKRDQQVFTTDEPKKQSVFTITDESMARLDKSILLNNASKKKEPAIRRKSYVKILLYCNNSCDHFYHKYEDKENCWCDKLNKCIALYNGENVMGEDYSNREIPEECTLQDV